MKATYLLISEEVNIMAFEIDNLPEAIRSTKKALRKALPNHAEVFRQVEAEMRRRVDIIVKEREAGQSVIPIVQFSDVKAATVSADLIAKIKDRGACVIRGTFDRAQAQAWDNEIATYVEENGLDAKLANAAEDKYFGTLASAKPQIYGIYWSRPQVQARQSEQLTRVRVFLNNLWQAESEGQRHFDPNVVPVYADRIRRRPPGSASLGLSPHVDGGSVERWLDENFRKVYRHVFSGDWLKYNAFDAAFRPEVRELPSPAVCSMFRTFQGWTALTRQGQGDGTLQLIPIAESMVYVLLRALQDDVPEDDLCGAAPGRALSINPQYHSLLIQALSSIPLMEPGDTVFWHSDVVHAVENEHRGKGYSNVMYISSTPGCAKNTAYLAKQAPSFLSGKTPPDFAPDDFEVDFKGRGTEADLTPLGRSQLGLSPLGEKENEQVHSMASTSA
jgi:translation initiation factor 1 (eIF-1/SUI1)